MAKERKEPGSRKAVLKHAVANVCVCVCAGETRVRISDVGRAQENEAAVVRTQVYNGAALEGAALETHGTIRKIMSLRDTQGTVGEAHVIQGDAVASKSSTYRKKVSAKCVLVVVFKQSEAV